MNKSRWVIFQKVQLWLAYTQQSTTREGLAWLESRWKAGSRTIAPPPCKSDIIEKWKWTMDDSTTPGTAIENSVHELWQCCREKMKTPIKWWRSIVMMVPFERQLQYAGIDNNLQSACSEITNGVRISNPHKGSLRLKHHHHHTHPQLKPHLCAHKRSRRTFR